MNEGWQKLECHNLLTTRFIRNVSLGKCVWKRTLKPKSCWSYANIHICLQMQIFKVVKISFQKNYDVSVSY